MNRREFAVALFVLASVAAVTVGIGAVALAVDNPEAGEDRTATIDDDGSIAAVHEAGVTGENVSVGVLDVTGFDQDAIDGEIAGSETFGDGQSVDGGDRHGTATAMTVARTAPDAELYLATFETPDDYASALDWMLERDVDVIVTPVAYAGTLGDGTASLDRATRDAVDRGAVVVAPTGNFAAGHWYGEYEPTDEGLHEFEVGPLNEVHGPPGRAEFWLASDAPGDYTLELHRLEDDETELVARSVAHRNESQRLTVQLDDDRYAIAVRGPDGAEVDGDVIDGDGNEIRVATTTHALADARPERSIPSPAAAPGVIGVGAIDPTTGEVEPFSGRGPTADGRLGVYVVAPSSQPTDGGPFVGTSASAAYVGGVAALVVDVGPELEPDEVRWTLASTAGSQNGVDTRAGHGRVDPAAAIAEAAERSDRNDE
ncbi:subtilase family protease [Halalkaliarchaeum desulfuricum]|uniref:Subtilase family protease n=1 Tax=Halalkaliarchaeum desulfuricum TaxID=2055893 RepID=A0A343TFS0_9EURY|nr:S8 family serine peptidase [Halalkaliarchaeum desulfuricum]AUX07942.1 subtilase family protease [Halalkaliarchaeum desulfuricum]